MAECGTCGGQGVQRLNEPKIRWSPPCSIKQQLENCRETIELALKQLSLVCAADRSAAVEEDMFNDGPQGAD
jgi:hypothetical protein